MPCPQTILPTLYYHDHFQEMIDFVTRLYGPMFGPAERAFLDDFRNLDRDCRCLYLRLCNRKRMIFHPSDLRYGEISNLCDALHFLKSNGWISAIDANHYEDLLRGLTKPTLLSLVRDALPDLKSGWKKEMIVEKITQDLPFTQFILLHPVDDYVTVLRRDDFQFLLYLYFGKAQDSLTSFALRDLGIAQTNDRQSFGARFRDMAEAKAGYFYNAAIKRLKNRKPRHFHELANATDTFPSADTDFTRTLRDSLLHMTGQYFEKAKETDTALSLYAQSDSFECRERIVRLLCANGQKEKAQALLEAMIAEPSCDEEYFFASDFSERKFGRKKLGIYSEILRNSTAISVDEHFRGSAEHAAIRHFKKQGWAGYHTENYLWNGLFGLLFWDELFEDPEAMGSAFDSMPLTLKTRQFHIRHADAIRRKLDLVREGATLDMVLATYMDRQDEPNSLFGWHEDLRILISGFLSVAKPDAVASILEKMAQDYLGMSDGFPDLMLLNAHGVRFVEIKAEGDQIRRNQLARMMQLRAAGFDTDICRVQYHVDPDQIYVVLDVETTGGRPPFDRVTEIGAVKMRGGEIIGEFSTLLNPERPIPAMITKLTGITNDMVADAPFFADIAEELSDFLSDCVFVAHNVNFDYGFIGSEFRRLDMPFRYPKLCTCSSMRKFYPGHASYSLGNLCNAYGIALDDHHRALCDAKAAAELLTLINRKRLTASDIEREAA